MSIRDLRQRKLLSQQELAEKAGVSKATIVKIEGGRVRPHPATLRRLAEVLGVKPEVLASYLDRD